MFYLVRQRSGGFAGDRGQMKQYSFSCIGSNIDAF